MNMKSMKPQKVSNPQELLIGAHKSRSRIKVHVVHAGPSLLLLELKPSTRSPKEQPSTQLNNKLLIVTIKAHKDVMEVTKILLSSGLPRTEQSTNHNIHTQPRQEHAKLQLDPLRLLDTRLLPLLPQYNLLQPNIH